LRWQGWSPPSMAALNTIHRCQVGLSQTSSAQLSSAQLSLHSITILKILKSQPSSLARRQCGVINTNNWAGRQADSSSCCSLITAVAGWSLPHIQEAWQNPEPHALLQNPEPPSVRHTPGQHGTACCTIEPAGKQNARITTNRPSFNDIVNDTAISWGGGRTC
jgi:hypothetical protein